jgi:hypothetical protein
MANVFEAHDTTLNPFLFATIGEEANGSSLTILSLLARLGKDPWDEAAAWSRVPKEAAVRALADSISQMPPNRHVLEDVDRTASRLVAMLPGTAEPKGAIAMPASIASMPRATLVAFVYVSLFLALNLWFAAAPKPAVTAGSTVHVVAAATK